jgi:PIN domain nuclease of toxin-antitoxin system
LNYLLDTHIFLWWLHQPEKLSVNEFKAIENPENNIYVSAVVAWEVMIKSALNKLTFKGNILAAIEQNQFTQLPISTPQCLHLKDLPPIHQDPFDRLLICQSLHEGMTILTQDQNILRYAVKVLR